jgi:para-aminobenzoate synthetase component 2
MIAVIDNYDSFVYNLVQYLGELGADVRVVRNDEVSVDELAALAPSHLLVSPGPCTPNEAGISIAAIERFAGEIPVFGVCLGHQAMGQAFGGQVVAAGRLMHGKTSTISHDGEGVFAGVPSPFQAIRYHSLAVRREGLPDVFEITAESEDGEIMGLRHKELMLEGVQFHPESIMTEHGHAILANFLAMVGGRREQVRIAVR